MFSDARSKKVLFVSHCVLNQNSISDGTADYPGFIEEVVALLSRSQVGVGQMPCPELMCLGLDRGNVEGSGSEVVVENTRIRGVMEQEAANRKLGQLVQQVVFQIREYQKYGFDVRGVVGINRSPSCGVETTSKDNQEVSGEGVFIEALRKELEKNKIYPTMVGIKASEPGEAVKMVQDLIGGY